MKFKLIGTLAAAVMLIGFIPALAGCSSTSYVQTVQDSIVYTLYYDYGTPDDDSDDSAVAEDDYYDEEGNVIMSSDGLYYVVTGYSSSVSDATIVAQIEGIPVKGIASQAFINCRKIKSLFIEDGVESVGGAAFAYCTSLKSVTLPASLQIGYSMFSQCSSLTSVTLADGVEVITNRAFWGCTSLTQINADDTSDINLPSSLKQIEYYAFYGCSSLSGSLVIPEGVTTIEQLAFAACSSLTDVQFLGNVTEIGYAAFNGCSSFVTVTLPQTVERIYNGAFSYCTSLTSINIPYSVEFIGASAFEGCDELSSVKFEGSSRGGYLYTEELGEGEDPESGDDDVLAKRFTDYNYYGDTISSHYGYVPYTVISNASMVAGLLTGDCCEAYWYLVTV